MQCPRLPFQQGLNHNSSNVATSIFGYRLLHGIYYVSGVECRTWWLIIITGCMFWIVASSNFGSWIAIKVRGLPLNFTTPQHAISQHAISTRYLIMWVFSPEKWGEKKEGKNSWIWGEQRSKRCKLRRWWRLGFIRKQLHEQAYPKPQLEKCFYAANNCGCQIFQKSGGFSQGVSSFIL